LLLDYIIISFCIEVKYNYFETLFAGRVSRFETSTVLKQVTILVGM
jgi:hypothetical protein